MSLNNTGTMAAGPPSKPNSTQPAKGKDAHVLPQPVLLHSTPAAQAGRYLHLAGLLGLFGSQFNSLVEDPVRTLQNTLPLVAIIQVAYVSACLPVAGSQATKAVRKPRPGEKRKQEHAGPNPYVVSCWLGRFDPLSVLYCRDIVFLIFMFAAPHRLSFCLSS